MSIHPVRCVIASTSLPPSLTDCLIQPWIPYIDLFFLLVLQAEILASYKPVINSSNLIRELKQVQKTMNRALECFNSTRRIVLYYEDVLKNRTVCLPPSIEVLGLMFACQTQRTLLLLCIDLCRSC